MNELIGLHVDLLNQDLCEHILCCAPIVVDTQPVVHAAFVLLTTAHTQHYGSNSSSNTRNESDCNMPKTTEHYLMELLHDCCAQYNSLYYLIQALPGIAPKHAHIYAH